MPYLCTERRLPIRGLHYRIAVIIAVLISCHFCGADDNVRSGPAFHARARAESVLLGALPAAERIPDPKDRTNALHSLVRSLAMVNGDKALAVADGLSGTDRRAAQQAAAEGLVLADAPRGIAYADQINYWFGEAEIKAALVTALARVDAKRSLDLAFTESECYGAILLRAASEALVAADPEQAITAARSRSDVWERRLSLIAVADSLAEVDPQRARGVASIQDVPEWRGYTIRRVAGVAARSDPALGLRLLKEIRDRKERRRETENVILNMAPNHPNLAVKLALGVGGDRRDALLWSLGRALAPVKPEVAVRLVRMLKDRRMGRETLSEAAVTMARTNPRKALTVAREIDDSYYAGRALSAAAARIARTDLDGALAIAKTEPECSDDILAAIAVSIAGRQPERALPIANRIKTAWIRAEALQQVAETRSRVDLTDGLRIAATLQGASDRDAALLAIARSLRGASPEAALRVANRISSDLERVRTISSIALGLIGVPDPEPDLHC